MMEVAYCIQENCGKCQYYADNCLDEKNFGGSFRQFIEKIIEGINEIDNDQALNDVPEDR